MNAIDGAAGAEKHTTAGKSTLPRTQRLLKPTDFTRVFRKNQASTDRCFRVLSRANDGVCSRLGMAVSRKIDPKAVGRNRIKRVPRESFRHWAARQREAGGPFVDIVVLPRYGAATICNEQLFRSLEMHWSRIESRANDKPAIKNGQQQEQD